MIWELFFWLGATVVFIAYPGYALWAAALAVLRPRPVRVRYRRPDELPSVTCVMAAANEGALIGRKLKCVLAQDYPPEKIQIIVVSDASIDDTDRVVAGWSSADSRVRLLSTGEPSGKPTALNLAWDHIDHDIVVLMDVRQGLNPTALRELVAHLEDPQVGAVSGNLLVRGDAYWTYEGFLRRCESRSGSMVQVTGSLYALRTADLPEIPAETILDDVYVPLLIAAGGRRIVMAERALSLDVVTRSARSEFIRKVRTLAGLVDVCYAVPGCLNPSRNPLWARFLFHKLSRLACPYGMALAFFGALFAPSWTYQAALAAAVGLPLLLMAAERGLRSRLFRMVKSLVVMNLAALWAVPSYYLGRPAVTWARVETDRT
jgi:cellulose synthase/poly-beta-1,6-N-acetylglucosamine synthase-like glycosyltransferase